MGISAKKNKIKEDKGVTKSFGLREKTDLLQKAAREGHIDKVTLELNPEKSGHHQISGGRVF